MRIKVFPIFWLVVLSIIFVFNACKKESDKIIFSGTVYDSVSLQPLEGVKVYICKTCIPCLYTLYPGCEVVAETKTGANGRYLLIYFLKDKLIDQSINFFPVKAEKESYKTVHIVSNPEGGIKLNQENIRDIYLKQEYGKLRIGISNNYTNQVDSLSIKFQYINEIQQFKEINCNKNSNDTWPCIMDPFIIPANKKFNIQYALFSNGNYFISRSSEHLVSTTGETFVFLDF